MSTEVHTHPSSGTPPTSQRVTTAAKAGLTAGTVALAANLAIFGIARLAGLELEVTQPGATDPLVIGPTTVALMTLAPTALGTLLLAFVGRRGSRAWRTVGWLGLAAGVLTVPMPFTVEASAEVSTTLASLHLVVGAVWLAVLLVTVRRSRLS